ncbi:TPA_asm: hypothetical protein vir520_00027 [Caudoviricetes sp. vir520]|nr:TPA_asm: hypothetical protein vir520_00027 [Caudoviricetes sp. vir520]
MTISDLLKEEIDKIISDEKLLEYEREALTFLEKIWKLKGERELLKGLCEHPEFFLMRLNKDRNKQKE